MQKPMIFFFFILLAASLINCQGNRSEEATSIESQKESSRSSILEKPKVSFTFDDGITRDLVHYKFEDWNQMILDALEKENLNAIFFVTGKDKMNPKGAYLLNEWASDGHIIANHTFTHPNFNNDKVTIADFESELTKTDAVIKEYDTYTKLFRFPYLKEGNTNEKVEGYRAILKKHEYRNGHVSIDASDWFVNSELIKDIRKNGSDSTRIEAYKDFYLAHILDRANYYEALAFELTGRHIHHSLLLHHNLSSALFLDDLMERFKAEGWALINADDAYKDEVYDTHVKIVPAGESIIWSIAKAQGNHEDILRYPAEDSRYEAPKMKELGLLNQ